jgi:hypothetical protein
VQLTGATVALFACVPLLCLCVEAGARIGLGRVSKIHRRIVEDRAQTRNLTAPFVDGRETILFVGNSLLLEGVDMDILTSGLQPRYAAQRFPVESTQYFDWLYGLKRFFRDGMRPATVVVCLTAPQMASPSIRGDFSALVLFGFEDIWPAARDSGATLTKTSGYYLAHSSAFYGARAEIRSVIMGKIAPPVPSMWLKAVTIPGVNQPDTELIPVIAPRLATLRDLCASYGARFELLLPPLRAPGDTAAVSAGEQAGVRVLRPVPNMSLPEDCYRDGFHLNAKGSAIFTKALVEQLRRD